MKSITITAQPGDLGEDTTSFIIYHTSINSSNILDSSVTVAELEGGLTLDNFPDNAENIIIFATGLCSGNKTTITKIFDNSLS